MAHELILTVDAGRETSVLHYEAEAARAPVLVLAHGAGAGQRSPFITAFAEAMRTRGITAVTFDFPYMHQRRRMPDRTPVLEATWRAVIDHVRTERSAAGRLAVGGKSMGGRIASHVLSDPARPLAGVDGLVLLGYPLHPPGQPDRPRTSHLPELTAPTLVVQGSADAFGAEDELRQAFSAAPAPVDWLIIAGGDHSFKVPRGGGRSQGEVMLRVYETVAAWIHERSAG
jgi:uncharacterized protein